MLSFNYKLVCFYVLILVTLLNAESNEAPAETTVAPAHHTGTKVNASVYSDQEPEIETAEDIAIGKDLAEVQKNICEILLGECWLLYEKTKPHLDEEHREMICLKRVRGFGSCMHLTESEMKKAIETVEKKKKLEEEKEAEKCKKEEERQKQLDKLKEEWNQIRMKARGENPDNCTSTTLEPDVSESPDMSENPDLSTTLATDSIEIDS